MGLLKEEDAVKAFQLRMHHSCRAEDPLASPTKLLRLTRSTCSPSAAVRERFGLSQSSFFPHSTRAKLSLTARSDLQEDDELWS